MSTLDGRTIAFLVAPEGVEQVELTDPWAAVEQEGGTPRLVSTQDGKIQAFHHLDRADTFGVDAVVADADPATYDALVLPGGVANPDALRMDGDAVAFVQEFFAVDAGGGRRGPGPAAHVVAEPPHRPAERRSRVGRRGGRRRRQPRHQPEARRPAGVQRGARGAARVLTESHARSGKMGR